MHIVDLTNPDSPSIALTYHFNEVGDGEITDVAVCDDTVAVSISNNDKTLEGHVQYFLPFTSNDQTITKLSRVTGIYIQLKITLHYIYRGRRGRDSTVVRFTATYAIGAYHH